MMRRGFTLLEILVAMAILAIIILIVGGIFHQSTTAFESGVRKTDINMEGRAAMDLMASELSRAVADGEGGYFTNVINGNSSEIEFWTMGMTTNGGRMARHVKFRKAFSGNNVEQVVEPVSVGDLFPYASRILGAAPVPLAEYMVDLNFHCWPDPPNGFLYNTNLPVYIDITLQLSKGSHYSTIRVWSDGPSLSASADNINSWDSKL